ncbi:zinc-dependent alcohol dehydrogenase [Rhodococcus sp. T7]|uniref:zinc-dependent alcohol dehydrogenase n=1 Tax=Rhodococcus sp. T7 TaxID=627444 RepID=UPI001357D9D3|nr:alcohol dehydrogenase catalytic domain-containing protein [Rhodococcus sp. T7]KAF0957326.1 L-threonine 3-dehydrogenase [Rhodococcus sp. T7]KAF0959181.1 L-threonine 3-dehydrogenase [Rhodococcus sp. T7]
MAESVSIIEYLGSGQLRFAERPLPQNGGLLALETTGICTTDRHIVAGRIPVPAPSILGHELIGTVERLVDLRGDHVRVGDRVLVAPGINCGTCFRCTGARGGCPNRIVYGLDAIGDRLTGGFATHMELLPGSRVFQLSTDLAADRAIFTELAACVASGLYKAFGSPSPPQCSDVAVIGFGPIGLAAATLVCWYGNPVVVVERDTARADLARRLGFEVSAGDVTVDVVLECAGTPAAFAAGLELLGHAGTLVELGNAADLGHVSVSPSRICLTDLRIVGSAETRDEDFPLALRAVTEAPVDLPSTISHVHRFDDLADPNELFDPPDVFKARIDFEPKGAEASHGKQRGEA